MIDKGRAFSTIKVYLAAISACHVGFGRDTAGRHPLVRRFMKVARRRLFVPKPLFPSWDLSLVLDALCQQPFEPLGEIDMKLLSLKTALLLALSTAKRVCLIPNPSFMPKVMNPSYHCAPIELRAFHPPPFSSSEEQRLNSLCPLGWELGLYRISTKEGLGSGALMHGLTWASARGLGQSGAS
ncbi:hypothetical protein N1851_012342 [Merluccius polli]|uniref:Uncharacterized protein n=1 Tax=Merluccius polli TaxID=89951 RepID=A0AA47MXI5_MERPO|nr:hypothetical protein N1851_012342 [Merluccius polli]